MQNINETDMNALKTIKRPHFSPLKTGIIIGLILLALAWFTWWMVLKITAPGQRLVSLMDYCNASLTNAPSYAVNHYNINNLAEFPSGVHQFAGVLFSVNGVIQLGNRDYARYLKGKYPPRVDGIPVQAQCKKLHLLHGTAIHSEGQPAIAYLELHYASGQSAKLPIVYGRHLRDWYVQRQQEHAPEDPGTKVAWYGNNPEAMEKKFQLRVFRTTFANPRPNDRIETIDYVSTLGVCAPFMLALTIE